MRRSTESPAMLPPGVANQFHWPPLPFFGSHNMPLSQIQDVSDPIRSRCWTFWKTWSGKQWKCLNLCRIWTRSDCGVRPIVSAVKAFCTSCLHWTQGKCNAWLTTFKRTHELQFEQIRQEVLKSFFGCFTSWKTPLCFPLHFGQSFFRSLCEALCLSSPAMPFLLDLPFDSILWKEG